MTGWKRVTAACALLVLIALAVTWIIRSRTPSRDMPSDIKQHYDKADVAKIDRGTLEVVTKRLEEWEKLGQKNGQYKNPKTGDYTMVTVITCVSCGEQIPLPEYPPNADMGKRFEIGSKYMCPRCGKRACK